MAALALRAFACVSILAASLTARADAPASVFLEDLTSPELAARIRAGTTTVIVPIGGTEQNGAHMALGKHNVRVSAAVRAHRARSSATPSWPRSSRTCRKAASTRQRVICVIPAPSPCRPTSTAA